MVRRIYVQSWAGSVATIGVAGVSGAFNPPQVNGHSFRIVRRQLTGDQLRNLGMAIAEAAVPEWSALGKHTLYHYFCPTYEPVHSEMVTDLIGKPRIRTGYKLNNAVGSLFGTASKRGIIVEISSMKAEHPESHSNKRNVWEWTGKIWISKVRCPYCAGYI